MSPTSPDEPRRGQVWWVAFDPSIGGGIRKTRPAVVVSNDAANRVLNRIRAVPLTSKTNRLYPGEACALQLRPWSAPTKPPSSPLYGLPMHS